MHLFSSINRNFVLIALLILFCKIFSHQLMDFVGAVKLSQLSNCETENLRNSLIIKYTKRGIREEHILKRNATTTNSSIEDSNNDIVNNHNNTDKDINLHDHDHGDHLVVDIIAVVFSNINLIACSFVIYSAFVKWRKCSLSMSNRVPLYLSFSDVHQYFLFMPSLVYSIVNNGTIPGAACKVIAYLFFLQMSVNMILLTSVSVITYLRVVKRMNIKLGSYDWKFFVVIIILSIILSAPSVFSLGPSRFWCLTNAKPANIVLINNYALFVIAFIITCFCYFKTLSTILNVDRESMTDSSERIDQWSNLEKRALRRILIYIALFIMKWIPLVTFGVGVMLGYDYVGTNVVFIILFNLGGICNCGLYLMNEGIPKRENSTPQQVITSAASLSPKTNIHQSEIYQDTVSMEVMDSVSLNLEEGKIIHPPSESSRQSNNGSTVGDNGSSRNNEETEEDVRRGDEIKVIEVVI